jgi:predicted DCC family thiol-disulfide oxidoreductase YuxK
MIMPVTQATKPAADDVVEEVELWEVEVFYDGDCPLCKREIAMLRRHDSRHAIRFTDISDFRFDPQEIGIEHSTLMAEIHGRLPDGSIIRGVEVFRRLYAAIGFQRLVRITRFPLVAPLLELVYRFFAKVRLKLPGRRCDDQCYR